MQTDYQGFLRAKPGRWFKVVPGKIAPESLLATECLVKHLANVTHLATGKLLDIGCSTKPYKPLLENCISTYYGLDVPFTTHNNSFVDVFALGQQLPFRAGVFNTVLCTEVLEHVPCPAESIIEISRVLVPGGIAIVSTPFYYRIHEAPWDFYRYTPYALKHLAEQAGLALTEIHPRGGYLTVFADVFVKGLGLMFGGIRRALRISSGSQVHNAYDAVHRTILMSIQKGFWLLLRNDTLASDRFTLGYVFIMRKPIPSHQPEG